MEVLVILVPLAIVLGAIGLAGFLWSLRSGQYDDLDGAAWRAIADDEPVGEEEAETGEIEGTGGPLRHAGPASSHQRGA